MRLSAWMEAEGLKDDGVVERLRRAGVSSSRTAVSHYRRGLRRPEWDVIAGLRKISRGKVSADDFLELREAS